MEKPTKTLGEFLTKDVTKARWARAATERLSFLENGGKSDHFQQYYDAIGGRLEVLISAGTAPNKALEINNYIESLWAKNGALSHQLQEFLAAHTQAVSALVGGLLTAEESRDVGRAFNDAPSTLDRARLMDAIWERQLGTLSLEKKPTREEAELMTGALQTFNEKVFRGLQDFLDDLLAFVQTLHWTSFCLCIRLGLQYNEQHRPRISAMTKTLSDRCVLGIVPALPQQVRLLLQGFNRGDTKVNIPLLAELATPGFYFGVPDDPEGVTLRETLGGQVISMLDEVARLKDGEFGGPIASKFSTEATTKVVAAEIDPLVAAIDSLLLIGIERPQKRVTRQATLEDLKALDKFREWVTAEFRRSADKKPAPPPMVSVVDADGENFF